MIFGDLLIAPYLRYLRYVISFMFVHFSDELTYREMTK